VYAARDPDLDRRIALKVLRGVGSDPARARLLREARAMAKLSHPAVVTVHEVGTAGGVDYVAMELIDGSTLAEWIATTKPTQVEILEAFEVAGRGVASAHAAGLVHRDFKPQNVLRSKRGRVVVTDFGLARAALDDDPSPRPSDPNVVADAGSLSSTLTATGAVLGTPAYMSPEQHDGAAVGPAADQFAYCVALWEALAGVRPFPGHTLGEVRKQIDRGPNPAGETKIPRRLRAPIRRGLSVDPNARFPTMDALLAVIHRRTARVWAFAAAGAVVIAAIVVAVMSRSKDSTPVVAPLAGCGAAETELASYVNSPAHARLAANVEGKRLLGYLDTFSREWMDVQRAVCARPEEAEHSRRVTCLRVVRADLERTLAALGDLTPAELEDADAGLGLGDPKTCSAPRPPTRVLIEDPVAIKLVAAGIGSKERREKLVEPTIATPCLRGMYFMARLRDYASLPFATVTAYKASVAEAADRCGDDRFGASVTVLLISTSYEEMVQDPTAASRVDAAITRSGGDRSLSVLRELVDGLQARFRADFDGSIDHISAAAEIGLTRGVRQLAAATTNMAASYLSTRSGPGDLDRAESLLRRAVDVVGPKERPAIQRALFPLLYGRGKLDEAMRLAAEIHDRSPPEAGTIHVTGRLVDEAGKPVAGARVVGEPNIMVYGTALDPIAPAAQTAVTAADGTFSLAAPKGSSVMAAIDTRSAPPVAAAPHVELRMRPTGSANGRVTIGSPGVGLVRVGIVPDAFKESLMFTTAIAADGTWKIDGVPLGKATVVADYGAGRRQHRQTGIVIGTAPAGPIATELAVRGVPLHVVVRNQVDVPLSTGFVWIVRGKYAGKVVHEIEDRKGDVIPARALPVRPENAPAVVRSTLRSGDAITRYAAIEPGEVSVCAIGASGNFADAEFTKRFDEHSSDMPLTCVATTVTQPDQVTLVEVPPMKRFP